MQDVLDYKDTLSALTAAMIRLSQALTAVDSDHGRRLQDACRDILRPLVVARVLNKRYTVAVAGPQGVGKTSIVQALYELDDWLDPDYGQGELLPVFIIEDATVDKPQPRLIKFDILDAAGEVPDGEVPEESDEAVVLKTWAEALRGNRPEVLYPELRVPPRFFTDLPSGMGGLVLLPGYEKVDDTSTPENRLWQEFMRESLAGAAAVLLVTRVATMATVDATAALTDLRERYLAGAQPVVVVNAESRDMLAEARATAARTFDLPEDQIVGTWPAGFSLDVNEVAGRLQQPTEPTHGTSPAVRTRMLEKRVGAQLGALLDQIEQALADMDEQKRHGGAGEGGLREILGQFDAACLDLRRCFEDRLGQVLLATRNAATKRADKLRDAEMEGKDNYWRRAKEAQFGFRPSAMAMERQNLILRAWHGDDPTKPSELALAMRDLLRELTRQRLAGYGITTALHQAGTDKPATPPAPDPTALAVRQILTGERSDDPEVKARLLTAVQLLPSLALEWAALAATVPAVAGLDRTTLEPGDEDTVRSTVESFSETFKGLTGVHAEIVQSLATIVGTDGEKVTSLSALVLAAGGGRAVATKAAARIAGGAAAAMIALTVFSEVRRRLNDGRRMTHDALREMEHAEREVRMQAFDELMGLTRNIVVQTGRRVYGLDAWFGELEHLKWCLSTVRSHRSRLLRLLGGDASMLG
ncbi:MAG: hypothetical protein JO281_18960 [Pseudonocardiales bacterium]|nr:hypothetical protein [Pseudonocardiales bacterium]